jgi:hypothetical protein
MTYRREGIALEREEGFVVGGKSRLDKLKHVLLPVGQASACPATVRGTFAADW